MRKRQLFIEDEFSERARIISRRCPVESAKVFRYRLCCFLYSCLSLHVRALTDTSRLLQEPTLPPYGVSADEPALRGRPTEQDVFALSRRESRSKSVGYIQGLVRVNTAPVDQLRSVCYFLCAGYGVPDSVDLCTVRVCLCVVGGGRCTGEPAHTWQLQVHAGQASHSQIH